MKLGIRFMPKIAKRAGRKFFPFALDFLPEVWMGIRMFGLPKLIVLIELAEDSQETLQKKVREVEAALKPFRVWTRVPKDELDEEKYWTMRRESFSLLRETVGDKRTAPFVEDFGVEPKYMPDFLPQVLKILKENGIRANIAGHAGDGNYHIIPLMNFEDPKERAKIVPIADKIYELIVQYHGTITAEHNDGIIRTPYLKDMYGEEMIKLFEEIKHIFDPQNIFNPGKKVGGTKEDIKKYLAKSNK